MERDEEKGVDLQPASDLTTQRAAPAAFQPLSHAHAHAHPALRTDTCSGFVLVDGTHRNVFEAIRRREWKADGIGPHRQGCRW